MLLEPGADAAPPRHPGLRAGAHRGQGDPDPPARLHGVQRRLRRRPDGRAPAAVGRGPGRGAHPDAVGEQHPVAGDRPADHRAHPGHGLRRLLPDLDGRRRARARARSSATCTRSRRAYEAGDVDLHAKIDAASRHRRATRAPTTAGARRATTPATEPESLETTPGRLFFNAALPEDFGFVNDVVGQARDPDRLDRRAARAALPQGRRRREPRPDQGARLPLRDPVGAHDLDRRREDAAGQAEILDRYENEAEKAEAQFKRGIITDDERRQKEIEIWTSANSEVGRAMEETLSRHRRSTRST